MYRRRRKVCRFCETEAPRIDYRDERLIGRFVSERGKIIPGRVTGVCPKHQRWLARAIKRARIMGLASFTSKDFY